MDRVILHCDLNSFYASVELLDHPELRDRPVAVCGDPNSRHGIILAKNEPAKRYKVQTAETIWQARRKCPELVLLPAHHWKYRDYSRRVNAVYERYTDLVEPFSIDESWLDITGSLHLFGGDAKALADEIRRVLREELGFEGVAMTDDLDMDAVQKYVEEGTAPVMALQAGADLVLTSDPQGGIPSVLEAVETGALTWDRLDQSVLRVLRWKLQLGLLSLPGAEDVQTS